MRVVVIGGGFAGLAAAVLLQERRHQVTLLERRGVLGGRATSYHDAVTGEDVDNGTHLMVGAYAATLDLVRRAGAEDLILAQDNLRIDYVDEKGLSCLDCPPIPAPWHLLAGLLRLRVPWSVRFGALRLGAAVRFGRAPLGTTLADYFRRTRQTDAARRLLWDPLSIAMVNQVPERAAAVPFCNAFRETFLTNHRASRLLFLRRGLAHLHERIAAYFEGRNGILRRRVRAEAIEILDRRVTGVRVVLGTEEREPGPAPAPPVSEWIAADAVVAAVPWPSLLELLPAALAGEAPFAELPRLGSSPIVTVELFLDRDVIDRPMLGLRDPDFPWLFDKGSMHGRAGTPQHLSFVLSAAGDAMSKSNGDLIAAAEAVLRRFFRQMDGVRVTRGLVLREPAATLADTPEAEALRPGTKTPVEGLYLAGDWTRTGLPATIEGAVRSGLSAARAIEGS